MPQEENRPSCTEEPRDVGSCSQCEYLDWVQTPVFQPEHAVARVGEPHVVRRDERREAMGRVHPPEQRVQLGAGLFVEVAGSSKSRSP